MYRSSSHNLVDCSSFICTAERHTNGIVVRGRFLLDGTWFDGTPTSTDNHILLGI